MADRRERFAASGASELAEHRRLTGGRDPIPRVVLLLDGYGAFTAMYERVRGGDAVQTVTRLAAEGRALGIHVIVTAGRRADVPGALAGVTPVRLVLRMADDDDYATLGLPRSVASARLPPGRGFTTEASEFQVAVAGGDPASQAAAVGAIADELADRHPGEHAPRIRALPAHIPRQRLPVATGALQAPIGLDYELLRPAVLDLADEHALIAGPLRSGRTTTLRTVVQALQAGTPALELHLLAPRRTALTDLDRWTSVATGEECAAAADRLQALLEEPARPRPIVIVVDDATELGEPPALERLARAGRDRGVRLLAAVESGAARRSYGGWLRELRSGRSGLLLQPDAELDGDLLGVRLPRHDAASHPPGRGYLIRSGRARLIQVAGD